MIIGERIKEVRQNKGLSLDKFSDLVGCSKSHLWGVENGKTQPGSEMLRSVCLETGVSGDFILGLEPAYPPKGQMRIAWLAFQSAVNEAAKQRQR